MYALFVASLASLSLFLFSVGPANAQRLPQTVRPDHYALTLTPDLKAATFSGVESIGVTLAEPTDRITLNAAEMFGIADQVGSIEAGKLANLIVTNGDPLEIRTELRYLFIDGKLTSTDNRHRDLYEQYHKRPQPGH
jgi:hypothetical protein